MPDEQDVAETLDDDAKEVEEDLVTGVEFPPDKLSALSQIGPLIDDRLTDEPIAERAQRETTGGGSSREATDDGAEEQAVHLTDNP
jgi:hypothetical protein